MNGRFNKYSSPSTIYIEDVEDFAAAWHTVGTSNIYIRNNINLENTKYSRLGFNCVDNYNRKNTAFCRGDFHYINGFTKTMDFRNFGNNFGYTNVTDTTARYYDGSIQKIENLFFTNMIGKNTAKDILPFGWPMPERDSTGGSFTNNIALFIKEWGNPIMGFYSPYNSNGNYYNYIRVLDRVYIQTPKNYKGVLDLGMGIEETNNNISYYECKYYYRNLFIDAPSPLILKINPKYFDNSNNYKSHIEKLILTTNITIPDYEILPDSIKKEIYFIPEEKRTEITSFPDLTQQWIVNTPAFWRYEENKRIQPRFPYKDSTKTKFLIQQGENTYYTQLTDGTMKKIDSTDNTQQKLLLNSTLIDITKVPASFWKQLYDEKQPIKILTYLSGGEEKYINTELDYQKTGDKTYEIELSGDKVFTILGIGGDN